MTTIEAYNTLAATLQNCLSIGAYKTFEEVNLIQESLSIIQKIVTNGKASENTTGNGIQTGLGKTEKAN